MALSKKSRELTLVLKKSLKLVQSEKELLERKITNPTLFHNTNHLLKSELKWSSTFSKRDLIELLAALDAISAITKTNGEILPFSKLVSSAEVFLNIKLPNSYKIRDEVLARKIKASDFLCKLKTALENKV